MRIGITVGRYQPLHKGHVKNFHDFLSEVDFLIIFIGSINDSNQMKDPITFQSKNPWTFTQREEFIRLSLSAEQNDKIIIKGICDFGEMTDEYYQNTEEKIQKIDKSIAWYINLKNTLDNMLELFEDEPTFILCGSNKDPATQSYLNKIESITMINKKFETLYLKPINVKDTDMTINATDIRNILETSRDIKYLEKYVPQSVLDKIL